MFLAYKPFFLIAVIFLFVGCAKEELNFEQPAIQIPKEQAKPVTKKGSLYSIRGGSLFADKKDLQIGDIIQVIINEELQSDTSNSRTTSNNSNANLRGGAMVPNASNVNPNSTVNSIANKFNSVTGFDVGVGSDSSFTGKAKTKIDETFETTVSVIIEQTYQNGNYFIKGSKQMLIDGQSQEIILSGVIRPYDISPENSVMSSQMANLKILYRKDGEERDALRTPWGTKILKSLWPF
ncbi:MAG: flagellar basal body L-ring protein FlgH [Arcobacteraceae bacterium]